MTLAERIADYLETNVNYADMTKREVAMEAVRLCIEDARDDVLRTIRGETP